jgi:hypothetical protein
MVNKRETVLIERYLKRVHSNVPGKGNIEVFINPSSKDRKVLGDIVRFTLDNKAKKVYAWRYDEAHHVDVSKGIGLKHKFNNPDMLTGAATWSGGKWIFSSSDFLKDFKKMLGSEREFIEELLNNDWSWANTYIDVDTTLDKLRKHI